VSTHLSLSWKPRTRTDLVFRRVGPDWVVFDPSTQQIHVLNLTAALVWTHCTGEHTVAEIEGVVSNAFTEAADPGVVAVLGEFREEGLLEEAEEEEG
jgi:hypothetical protein